MNLRRQQMNPRLGRSRVSFSTSLNNLYKFGGREIEQTKFNQHKRNRRQIAEIQNALAVICGAVIVCAFALRNGFLSAIWQLDAAYTPMWSNRSTENEEGSSIF